MTDQATLYRQEFERHCIDAGYSVVEIEDRRGENYRYVAVQNDWKVWQAALLCLRDRLAKAEKVDPEWRCFYCDDVFKDRDAAAEHFGSYLHSEPACKINIAKYREMEANVEHWTHAVHEETLDCHRALAAARSEHSTALRREEEAGYAKGVADARKEGLGSISEAALREALPKPAWYMNGSPVWLMKEITFALRSLGVEVKP